MVKYLRTDKRLVDKTSLDPKNRTMLLESQLSNILGNLSVHLLGTASALAKRNVKCFEEAEEIIGFINENSTMNWKLLKEDLQQDHSGEKPIKWAEIKLSLTNELYNNLQKHSPYKDIARHKKIASFIVSIITKP